MGERGGEVLVGDAEIPVVGKDNSETEDTDKHIEDKQHNTGYELQEVHRDTSSYYPWEPQ